MREMNVGRPPSDPVMSADELRLVVEKLGGVRSTASRISCPKSTLAEYLSGTRIVPPELVEKLRHLSADIFVSEALFVKGSLARTSTDTILSMRPTPQPLRKLIVQLCSRNTVHPSGRSIRLELPLLFRVHHDISHDRMARKQTRFSITLASVTLSLALVLGCSDGAQGKGSSAAGYLRSDSSQITTSWQSKMTVYAGAYQNEQSVVEAFGLGQATRVVIDANLNRFRYETPEATVEVYFDEGLDKPFHTLKYRRAKAFEAATWSSGNDLQAKWEKGAQQVAEFLTKVTKLKPVILVGKGNEEAFGSALRDGYELMLTIDGWLVWIDDLSIQIDAHGVYAFSTDEIPYDATPSGTIDCRTQAEIEGILAQNQVVAPAGGLSPPICYGFLAETTQQLTPFYLAVGSEGGPNPIPLDRTKTSYP